MNYQKVILLITIVVATVTARCPCGRDNFQVFYQGDACECGRKLPVVFQIPLIRPTGQIPMHHGYHVEVPKESKPSCGCNLDFNLETPLLKTPQLGSFGYQVQVPAKKKENDVRFILDYQLQVPLQKPNRLEGLTTHVDRVVLPKKDCDICNGRTVNPTLDMLRSCPKHGHLYRGFAPIVPIIFQKRYANIQPGQDPSQVLRNKRQTGGDFDIFTRDYRDIFNGDRLNRDFDTFSRDFFNGDMFTSFIENVEKNEILQNLRSTAETFLETVTPIVRSTVQTWLNSEVEDDIYAKNRFINKREASFEHSKEKKVFRDGHNHDYQTDSYIATKPPSSDKGNSNGNMEIQPKSEALQYMPEIVKSNERTRKHCESCGSKKANGANTCPHCGHSEQFFYPGQSEYFELMHGNPVSFTPGDQDAAPAVPDSRYAFDRLGHRFKIENNGNLKLINPDTQQGAPTVGSENGYESRQNEYKTLRDIINRHPDFMHAINEQEGDGLMDPPVNIALDMMKFIRDAAFGPNHRESDDSDEVGARYHNYMNDYFQMNPNNPVKRSFQIIPILQDKDDGSVLFKMLPASRMEMEKQEKVKKIDLESTKLPVKFEKEIPKKIKSQQSEQQEPTFLKTTKNGKKYEILTVPGGTGKTESEENIEIMKYIFGTQKRSKAPIQTNREKFEYNFEDEYEN